MEGRWEFYANVTGWEGKQWKVSHLAALVLGQSLAGLGLRADIPLALNSVDDAASGLSRSDRVDFQLRA